MKVAKSVEAMISHLWFVITLLLIWCVTPTSANIRITCMTGVQICISDPDMVDFIDQRLVYLACILVLMRLVQTSESKPSVMIDGSFPSLYIQP